MDASGPGVPMTHARLRRFVYSGQWLAAVCLPVAAIAIVIILAGGILMAGAVVICLPTMAVLLVPLGVGRGFGRIAGPEGISNANVLSSFVLWIAYLTFWVALSWEGPARAVQVLMVAAMAGVVAGWFGQLIAGLWARRTAPEPHAGPGPTTAGSDADEP